MRSREGRNLKRVFSPVNRNEEISMKKVFLTCMAVVALLAIASGASAITCTVDARPAATLLIPYFAVSLNPDASIKSGTPDSVDTLVAIGNASSAPMIAHVSVFNERSVFILDFNVALTGFDVQTWRMSDVLTGLLPSTPIDKTHTGPDTSIDPFDDVCQRNVGDGTSAHPPAPVYPLPGGFIRVRPLVPATNNDNTLASAAYFIPAFQANSSFAKAILDSLDGTDPNGDYDSIGCFDDSVDGVTNGTAVGYVTVDMANYCNNSNPSDPNYYLRDAIGMENNLFGDVIFLNGAGVGTYGQAAVAIESDPSFSGANQADDFRSRTFYVRYWVPSTETFCTNCSPGLAGPCPNVNFLDCNAIWDAGNGDEREPLGLRYAARYFQGSGIDSFFYVWRASLGTTDGVDLRGPFSTTGVPQCTDTEPNVVVTFFDEDENGVVVTTGPCPSGFICNPPPATAQFPLETQKVAIAGQTLPQPQPGGPNVGWAVLDFVNLSSGTSLDQAWVEYQFQGAGAFISAHFTGIQLDPSNCEPLGYTPGIDFVPVNPTVPGGPSGTGTPPAGTGP
jgi:hypothetical protein